MRRQDTVLYCSYTDSYEFAPLVFSLRGYLVFGKEEAHTCIYKRENYLNLTKELGDTGYKAVAVPVEVDARGFIGSSQYVVTKEQRL